MMNLKKERVLPADVYDALEFGALAVDGIGAKRFFDPQKLYPFLEDHNAPVCALGLAAFVDGCDPFTSGPVAMALHGARIYPSTSDHAVHNVNLRRGSADTTARVPFPDWASELGITRGVH